MEDRISWTSVSLGYSNEPREERPALAHISICVSHVPDRFFLQDRDYGLLQSDF